MQLITCRTSPDNHVTRPNAYLGRTADTLSALFLLLAVMLAGGYGPLTAQVAPAPASLSLPTDIGAGGHRSVPFISKQQLLASEAEDDKASPHGDGKPKAFLPSQGLELGAFPVTAHHASQAFSCVAAIAASPYEARAPPAKS
jgi:hypothetical protein